MELPKQLQCNLTNVINMVHIQTYASVLSTDELTTNPKQDREKWRAMFHTYIKLFTVKCWQLKPCLYFSYIYNALENFLENATGGVLEKIINKNLDAAKLELYSLQLYWKLTLTPAFFQDKMQLSMLFLYIC